MISAYCVVAYRQTGGIEIYGPYEMHARAATVAVMVASLDAFEAAYAIPLNPPSELPWGAS